MNVVDENRETVIKVDVLNIGDLEPAIERADVVYANPEITRQAKNIVSLMEKYAVKPLVWISSIGNFVAKIIDDPAPYARKNFGVNKPNTDGDKPTWY